MELPDTPRDDGSTGYSIPQAGMTIRAKSRRHTLDDRLVTRQTLVEGVASV